MNNLSNFANQHNLTPEQQQQQRQWAQMNQAQHWQAQHQQQYPGQVIKPRNHSAKEIFFGKH